MALHKLAFLTCVMSVLTALWLSGRSDDHSSKPTDFTLWRRCALMRCVEAAVRRGCDRPRGHDCLAESLLQSCSELTALLGPRCHVCFIPGLTVLGTGRLALPLSTAVLPFGVGSRGALYRWGEAVPGQLRVDGALAGPLSRTQKRLLREDAAYSPVPRPRCARSFRRVACLVICVVINVYVYCRAVLVHTVPHRMVLCVYYSTCLSMCTTMYMYNLNRSRWQRRSGAAVWVDFGSRVASFRLG